MPSGRVHTTTTVLLSAGLGYWAAFHLGYPAAAALGLAGGALAGTVVNPDLDLQTGSISNEHVNRLGGSILGLAWRWLWKPYALMIPHRSPLSHFPILSTAIRLAYIGCAVGWIYTILLTLHAVHAIPSQPALPGWVIWAAAGLCCADILHFILDQLFKN